MVGADNCTRKLEDGISHHNPLQHVFMCMFGTLLVLVAHLKQAVAFPSIQVMSSHVKLIWVLWPSRAGCQATRLNSVVVYSLYGVCVLLMCVA